MIVFTRGGEEAAAQMKFALVSSAEGIGKSMGDKLLDGLFGPESTLVKTSGKGGQLEETFKSRGGGDWTKAGGAIGDAIGTGIITAMGSKLTLYWQSVERGLRAAGQTNGTLSSLEYIFKAAEGGIFTRPTLTWVGDRGPEALVPLRSANQAPGASPLPSGGFGSDMANVERLLGQILQALTSSGSGPDAGVESAIYNAIQKTRALRARGLIGG